MNKLVTEYKNLIGSRPINVYVTPNIFTMKSNDYLKLLYQDCLNEEDVSQVFIKAFRVRDFPKLFWHKIKGENSVIHHHWLMINDYKSLLSTMWSLGWMSIYKIFGGKIVWTIHNKYPHQKKWLNINGFCRSYMAKYLADKLHVHCLYAIKVMMPILNVDKNKFFIIKHPEYNVKRINKNDALVIFKNEIHDMNINTDDVIFFIFGRIAKYKRIDTIIRLFMNTFKGQKKYKILIVGGVNGKSNIQYLKEIKIEFNDAINKQVFIIDEFISPELTDVMFSMVDIVLFNFEDILTSGSVIYALSHNKNIIVPSKGCLTELNEKNILKYDEMNVDLLNQAIEKWKLK